MTVAATLLTLQALLMAFCVASAIVARNGAAAARGALRKTQNDIHELMLELDRVRAAIRRIEGRQTARMVNGRDSSLESNPENSGGLPDPTKDPERWRAAVRLIGLKRAQEK